MAIKECIRRHRFGAKICTANNITASKREKNASRTELLTSSHPPALVDKPSECETVIKKVLDGVQGHMT